MQNWTEIIANNVDKQKLIEKLSTSLSGKFYCLHKSYGLVIYVEKIIDRPKIRNIIKNLLRKKSISSSNFAR